MSRPCRVLLLAAGALLCWSALADAAARELQARGLVLLGWDLKGKQGAAPATNYREVKSLLMYAEPDVVALHNARGGKEAGKEGSPLAGLARSLGMYYAFAPEAPGGDVGCGLLSRYPIENTKPLAAEAPKGSLAAMQAQISYERQRMTVVLLRPATAEGSRAAVAAVARLVSSEQAGACLVFGSWDAAADAEAAVREWSRAGLVEAGATLGKTTPATSPQARPREHLDCVLVSQHLRTSLRRAEAVRHPAVKAIGERLPLRVTLARAMAASRERRRPR